MRLNYHIPCKIIVILCLLSFSSIAQDRKENADDSTFFLSKKKGWLGKLGKMVSNNSSADNDSIPLLINNATQYILYKGAIIRKIEIRKIGFGESINDTAFHKKNLLTDIANALHRTTREKTIRNNLFVRTGDSLYPYLLGDNARYLRDQPYLQDAKILVKPLNENYDSVDLIVLYKDLFSLSGSGEADGNSIFLQGQDDNLSGSGDRLQLSTFIDPVRNPSFGFGAEYMKRNINGTFVNFTAGYQNLNGAIQSGLRQETAFYTKLELPLVSPYYLWTGALEAYSRFTTNAYQNDSLYISDYKYTNYSYDAWAGYNISAKRLLHETSSRKPKQFIALRAAKINFTQIPNIYLHTYNYQYADVTSILGSFTFFKQDYYHTSYIYGFGRNEDVPEGFSASAIAGWTDKQGYQRPYAGIDLQKNFFTNRQGYFNYVARLGGYFYQGQFEDVGLLMSIESFDRLRKINKRWYERNFFSASFTNQFNTFLNEPLRINSNYGIPSYDNLLTLNATTRATANYECVLYSRWKVVGFGVAPFLGASLTYIKPKDIDFFKSDLYSSISAGFRTRNEALIFGTIEFRCSYFPKTINAMAPWNLIISTDLRFKYNSQFIKRPDFISLN